MTPSNIVWYSQLIGFVDWVIRIRFSSSFFFFFENCTWLKFEQSTQTKKNQINEEQYLYEFNINSKHNGILNKRLLNRKGAHLHIYLVRTQWMIQFLDWAFCIPKEKKTKEENEYNRCSCIHSIAFLIIADTLNWQKIG